MSFEKKIWLNVPDENNPPEIPEGQEALARFDADNMNRIEEGIGEAFEEVMNANVKNLVIQKITSSCEWIAPKAVKNTFRVFCVGAGGGGGECVVLDKSHMAGGGGGGGGYICISDIEIKAGTSVAIVCGAGGAQGKDGGTTIFGDYLTAEGGRAGKNATSSGKAGDGGDGGSGGGGGGVCQSVSGLTQLTCGNGGNGGIYGGGGGAGGGYHYNYDSYSQYLTPGMGGISSGCGNGGTFDVISSIGKPMDDPIINCFFNISYIKPIRGTGILGRGSDGISSYGGNPGRTNYENSISGGGGGGYCGDGGNSGVSSNNSISGGGGGGGGYCGNGGDGHNVNGTYLEAPNGGGGGGFFGTGGAGSSKVGGGGGGFFSAGSNGGIGGIGGVLIMYIKDDTSAEEE